MHIPSSSPLPHSSGKGHGTETKSTKQKTFFKKMGKLRGLVGNRQPKSQSRRGSKLHRTPLIDKTANSPSTPDTISDSPSPMGSSKVTVTTNEPYVFSTPEKPTQQRPVVAPVKANPTSITSPPQMRHRRREFSSILEKSAYSTPRKEPQLYSPCSLSENEEAQATNQYPNPEADATRLVNLPPPTAPGDISEPFSPMTLENQFNNARNVSSPTEENIPSKGRPSASFQDEVAGFIERSKDEMSSMYGQLKNSSPTDMSQFEQLGQYIQSAKSAASSCVEDVSVEPASCFGQTPPPGDTRTVSLFDSVEGHIGMECQLGTSHDKTKEQSIQSDYQTKPVSPDEGTSMQEGRQTMHDIGSKVPQMYSAPPVEKLESFNSVDSKGELEWSKTAETHNPKANGKVNTSQSTASTKLSEQNCSDENMKESDLRVPTTKKRTEKLMGEAHKLFSQIRVSLKQLSMNVGQHMTCTEGVVRDFIPCSEASAQYTKRNDRDLPSDTEKSFLSLFQDEADSVSKLTSPPAFGEHEIGRSFSLDLTEIENESSF